MAFFYLRSIVPSTAVKGGENVILSGSVSLLHPMVLEAELSSPSCCMYCTWGYVEVRKDWGI